MALTTASAMDISEMHTNGMIVVLQRERREKNVRNIDGKELILKDVGKEDLGIGTT